MSEREKAKSECVSQYGTQISFSNPPQSKYGQISSSFRDFGMSEIKDNKMAS